MPRGGKRPGAGRPRKPRGAKPTGALAGAIANAKDLTGRLLDELDAVTAHLGEIQDLIEIETIGDKDSRRREAMLKAVSLPARAGVLKTLVAAMRAWAELESKGAPPKKGEAAAVPESPADAWDALLDDPPARTN